MKAQKLNYLKMVKDINHLVDNDFIADMECNLYLDKKDFTQKEAKEMAKIIDKVMWISHNWYCGCSSSKYHLRNKKL